VKKNERITETILKLVSLENESNTYARNLSGGMKRRLLIGKAMVHTPPILVLDEPTAGVDVELRKKLWANILELNKLGVTIILSTHNLFEAETLCERIAILNHGKLLALDTTSNLIGRIETKKVIFKIEKNNKFENTKINNIEFKKIDDSNIEVTFNKNKTKIEEIVNVLKEKNLNLIDFTSKDADLEDVFIQLVNNG
jgi:ABC-2 type transport system ATP-binding protein